LFDIYVDELLYVALPPMRWEQFAIERTDLMKQPGDTIRFIRVNDIQGDPALTDELDEIDTEVLTNSLVDVTIGEYGKGEAVTERMLRTSPIDIMGNMSKTLGRHYSQWGPDKLLRDHALDMAGTASVTVVYGGDADARNDLAADDLLTTAKVAEIVELLQTRSVPKFNNEFYVCICHPHHIASLQQDPDWVEASNYAADGKQFNGEVGRWHDVAFLVTPDLPNSTVTTTTSKNYRLDLIVDTEDEDAPQVNVYTASLFGDEFYALAWALPVQLRFDTPSNFGRLIKIAWYAMYGAKVINPLHGVRIETA
jgi:N4-gp56 family major capsid protein